MSLINITPYLSNKINSIDKKISLISNEMKVEYMQDINSKIVDLIDTIWIEIYGKKRRRQKYINIDNVKNIKGFSNELKCSVLSKIEMIRKFNLSLNNIGNDMKNITSLDKLKNYIDTYKKRLDSIIKFQNSSNKILKSYETKKNK